jgi:SAM-dependent methyltransferase
MICVFAYFGCFYLSLKIYGLDSGRILMGKDTKEILQTYNTQAKELSDQYQSVDSESVLNGLKERLPRPRALEIACGNGRDAVWLARQGFIVDAVDGAEAMIAEAKKMNAHSDVSYAVDLMPDLSHVRSLGHKYDSFVMSAAWMHLEQEERKQMFDTMLDLANPGAIIFLTLRHGPAPSGRPMYAVSAEELKEMAAESLVHFEHIGGAKGDKLGRSDVWWDSVCLKMPSEHVEALSIFRESIIQAPKYTSYKLGLAHCLMEVVSNAPEAVKELDDSRYSVSLGDIMLSWAKLYDGLAEEGLPQIRNNGRLNDHLNATRRFSEAASLLGKEELEKGNILVGAQAKEFDRMMKSIHSSIVSDGPVKYITRKGSEAPVFSFVKGKGAKDNIDEISLDTETLSDRYGCLAMSKDIIEALKSSMPLIKAGVTQEWVRFTSKVSNMDKESVETGIRRVAGL